ncbi:MAG: hypothetical protein JST11_05280 [Acidobacteria bacterium]|nr:hypothetical protein [Acidobacteriota bacterium]
MQQNMWRIARILTVVALASLGAMAADTPGALKRYLQPAGITKLDWVLLKAEVESFTGDIRWDKNNVVRSVSLYAARGGLVGMTFVIDKERYIAVSDETARKTFADVVIGAANILETSIPEVKDGENVYADFVAVGGGIVGEYANGRVTLKK